MDFTPTELQIVKAGRQHVRGIVSLLDRYYKDNLSEEEKKDGFVSARFGEEELQDLLEEGNIAEVAVQDGQVAGVMFAGPWESWTGKPLFSCMAAGLPENKLEGVSMSVDTSCLYGPACLDRSIRGSGIFEKLFQAVLCEVQNRYPYMIAFIAKRNPRSFAAHTEKTVLEVTGEFTFGGEDYYYLACRTNMQKK